MPTTAHLLQLRWGGIAPPLEMDAACLRFMDARVTDQQFARTGCRGCALVVGVERISHAVNPANQRTSRLFGDGGSATFWDPHAAEQTCVVSSTRGAGGDADGWLCQPAGGRREFVASDVLAAGRQFIDMGGRFTVKRAVHVLVGSARDVLHHARLTSDDRNSIIFHQADARIVNAAIDDLRFERQRRVVSHSDRCGNTSAVSLSRALDNAGRQDRIGRRGDRVLLDDFGGGLSWGTAIVQWQLPSEQQAEDHQQRAGDTRSAHDAGAHFVGALTQAEMSALAMPQGQTCHDRRRGEQPQAPSRHAMLQQLARVADSRQRSGGKVRAVGDQAEPGEEAEHERARHPQSGRQSPDHQRQDGAKQRPRPSHDGRLRIIRQVRAGDGQRMQDHAGYASARKPSARDVAKLVQRLHSQPRADEGRND